MTNTNWPFQECTLHLLNPQSSRQARTLTPNQKQDRKPDRIKDLRQTEAPTPITPKSYTRSLRDWRLGLANTPIAWDHATLRRHSQYGKDITWTIESFRRTLKTTGSEKKQWLHNRIFILYKSIGIFIMLLTVSEFNPIWISSTSPTPVRPLPLHFPVPRFKYKHTNNNECSAETYLRDMHTWRLNSEQINYPKQDLRLNSIGASNILFYDIERFWVDNVYKPSNDKIRRSKVGLLQVGFDGQPHRRDMTSSHMTIHAVLNMKHQHLP